MTEIESMARLNTMSKAQREAMELQVERERADAVAPISDRLALVATIPVWLTGLGLWVSIVVPHAAADAGLEMVTLGPIVPFVALATLGAILVWVPTALTALGARQFVNYILQRRP